MDFAKNTAANAAIAAARPAIEKATARYLVLNDIAYKDKELTLSGALLGGERVTVTVGNILIAEDGATIRFGKAACSIAGLENLLSDFVVGKDFPIPEQHREKARMAKKLL
ncbi:MAG: hypothetical protein J5838_00530 [Desulfovibrio sp.]|nr:hypothetical protein [Desulfovibrio sp.]